ncbi:MAG: signal peptidase II [Pseudomonadota bacterium]
MAEMQDETAAADSDDRTALNWLWLSGVVIGLDQVSKWLVHTRIDLADRIVINPLLELTHRHNTGAAFSFLASQSGWQRWFFVALAIAVSGFIVAWLQGLKRHSPWPLAAGLSLILGGAIGNVIDRIHLGYVVDFVLLGYKDLVFPYAFNIADAAISVGAALLIIDALLDSFVRKTPNTAN